MDIVPLVIVFSSITNLIVFIFCLTFYFINYLIKSSDIKSYCSEEMIYFNIIYWFWLINNIPIMILSKIVGFGTEHDNVYNLITTSTKNFNKGILSLITMILAIWLDLYLIIKFKSFNSDCINKCKSIAMEYIIMWQLTSICLIFLFFFIFIYPLLSHISYLLKNLNYNKLNITTIVFYSIELIPNIILLQNNKYSICLIIASILSFYCFLLIEKKHICKYLFLIFEWFSLLFLIFYFWIKLKYLNILVYILILINILKIVIFLIKILI